MITVLRFTASWCAPCKMLAPIMEGMAQEFPGVVFEIVDVDGNPDLAQHFKVRSVPTVVICKDDVPVKTIVGAQPKKVYLEALEEIA